MSELLEKIVSCLDRGWHITPLCWPDASGRCACPKHHTNEKEIAKAPLLGGGYQDARWTLEEVLRYWARYPNANYGILLKPSSLFVLDADSLEADREIETRGVPPGPRVRRGDHVHRYFRNSEGVVGRAIHTGKSGKIDILSDGYVVGPGSLHRCGTRYIEEIAFAEIELDDPPRWSIDLVRNKACGRNGKEEAIPQDLAEVDIDSLPISRFIKALIRCGPATDPGKYPSRSESVFAVLIALLSAGINDSATLASILLNPRHAISEKPLSQGRKWLAGEIARARAKSKQGNGQAPSGASNEELNAWYTEQERPIIEEPPAPEPTAVWECPDHLWRGPFERVANVLGKKNWEIWVGTLMALAARAHRNLHFQYHRPLYGMMYALLVKPTGMGKGLATDVCHDLMPGWYTIRDAVQSGPALAPILAEIERNKKGQVSSVTPRPALLLIEEFTTLLKNASIQHSTLVDILNNLFHRRWPWNISRSDRPNSGGGDVVITDPTLTILATTTASLLKEHVSERMIRSGFLNRYLVLPGSTAPWKFYDPDSAGIDTARLRGLLDEIPSRSFGGGQDVWLAYTDDARKRLIAWGEQVFEPIMNSAEIEAETVKRLHMYSHLVALLYAWGEQEPKASTEHVECSIAAIETARDFLQSLVRVGDEPDIPKFKSYEINLEQKIIAKVQAKPGVTRRGVIQVIAGKKATSADVGGMIQKLLAVGRLVERKGGGNNPARLLYLPESAP